MTQQPHPERLDLKPSLLTKFSFDLQASSDAKKENDAFLQQYRERIDKLDKETAIEGMPVISQILKITHDKDDLKKLGKALQRVADLQEVVDLLEKRRQCLKLANEDPEWFALAFGDHAGSVDDALQQLGLSTGE